MKLTFSRESYFLVIDWLVLIGLTALTFTFPDWDGGPIFGIFLYALLRYLYAWGTQNWIHNKLCYRLWDLFVLISLFVASFVFPEWHGGPIGGVFLYIVLRALYEWGIEANYNCD